jgi:hypothetical protein
MAHAGGRPSKYRKRYCQTVIDLMKKGKSVIAVCAAIGICKDTFYEWTKTYLEFSEAHKLGMVYAERFWEDVGVKGVLGLGIKNPDGTFSNIRPGLYEFYMKNRFRWSDRVEQIVTADVNADVDVTALTPEERRQRVAELMQKAHVQP